MSFSAQELQAQNIMYAACSAAVGIIVKTTNPTRARQLFYATRQAIGDIALKDLQIRASPDNIEGEIWIIRKETTNTSTLSFT